MKKKLPTPQQLPSGMWRVQIMVDGKRVSVVEENPAVAQAKAIAMRNGLIEEKKKGPSMTVAEAVDRYLSDRSNVISPSTMRGYKSIRKNQLGYIENIKLNELTAEDIQIQVNALSKNHAAKTVANFHALVCPAIRMFCPKFEFSTTLPQQKKVEIKIPKMEEVRILLSTIHGTAFELPFLIAVCMGLRTSEIRGLKWDCINGNYMHIKEAIVDGDQGPAEKITKTYESDRYIEIPPFIMHMLDELPRDGENIFHLSRSALYNRLNRALKKAGIPHYRFHDLRHLHASVLLGLGIPDKYAKDRMGHISTNMLRRVYQHVMLEERDAFAAMSNEYFLEKLHTELPAQSKNH